jgi:hypothetical protein
LPDVGDARRILADDAPHHLLHRGGHSVRVTLDVGLAPSHDPVGRLHAQKQPARRNLEELERLDSVLRSARRRRDLQRVAAQRRSRLLHVGARLELLGELPQATQAGVVGHFKGVPAA